MSSGAGAPPTTAGRIRWAVLPARRASARVRPAGVPGTAPYEARIGDRTIVWSASTIDAGTVAGPAYGDVRSGTARSVLSLVTQVGRAFQDTHPRIPIILDRGRHLVIDGGKALWQKPVPRAGRADPVVAGLVAAVSRAPYEADVTALAQLPTRHSLSTGFGQAADRATAALTALGYATSRFPVSVGGGQSANVIAERTGSAAAPRGVVVVTAHLDSVNVSGGVNAPAPGADDNASGSAGVLILARILAGPAWEHDLRLILFGGEEQGLFGSRQYVSSLAPAERSRIRAVLNMDMIASRNGAVAAVLLEGATVSQALIGDLAMAAATYTGLRVETSLNPFASDHVPFLSAGIPAVLTIEGNDSANGHIHTADDLLVHVDYELALEILRMNVAALAGWLEPAVAPTPRPAGPVVSWGPGRLDVFVRGADHRIYHKSWNGTAWQPATTGYEPLDG